jgi:membrane peptidoglycan carboxypeptidase
MGRKASEAVRALALEAEYDKTEILEAYLDTVYFGHLDGIHIFGFDTAARAYFSKPASQLDSGESALLAAMIQGPNRLSPVRNPEAVMERYRWVLTRLVELDWLTPSAMHAARSSAFPELARRGGRLQRPQARRGRSGCSRRVDARSALAGSSQRCRPRRSRARSLPKRCHTTQEAPPQERRAHPDHRVVSRPMESTSERNRKGTT